ncbi:MAG TPA: imidazole glycerol phosphate synthase subunit HisH [Solirubrobacteraceae bacterium]|nr:imidazole glycerol phosphate synthase subunit HisH [Solirubrobacteraceae bacterium]
MSAERRPQIAVVDYGMGNRRSVQKALEHAGARAEITRDLDSLTGADALVVPGVGAFPKAMANLADLGLADLIRERAQRVPILGICLGMQVLFDSSQELGETAGLGLIAGEVSWLDAEGLRIPHIGWNEVRFEQPSALTDDLPKDGCPFYHVHSLAVRPQHDADIVGTTEYGERFATIVQRGLVFGVQFHPEKSSLHGLRMLGSFVRLCSQHAARAATTTSAGA